MAQARDPQRIYNVLNSLRYLLSPQYSLGCFMTGAFSSYFHASQTVHRFQFSNSVHEWFESPLDPRSLDLFCQWLCDSQLGVSNRRSYLGTETMDQAGCMSRDFIESNVKLSSCQDSSAHPACPSRGAGSDLWLGARDAQPAVHEGGEIQAKCWPSACSAYRLHPQMRTFQKFGDYFSLL